ncbi:MAG: efflux RND transporter permease subunit, partial [Candidatus Omnitrophica bacterium]|nr:efflux RND transporter permease subunit [Candidatus Omnitrophota bacterium]
TNIDEASNDVRDRIELAKRFLPDIPDEMENPYIFKFNTANIPIMVLGVTARETYPQLYDLIDNQVGDALRQLPGVGAVQLQGGGLERQINIWVDRQRLEGHGFSILDIQNVLRQENITQPVGNLKAGLTDYLIRLPGEFARPEEINTVILGKRNGKLVYLKDVARVEDGFKEVDNIVRINHSRGLVLMIQKQSGTNTVEVTRRVAAKLKDLEKNLPSDVKINIIFNTAKDILDSLNTLKDTVWIAVVLVVLVVWFFLRHFLASAIIALTLPFSLLISFIYLFLSGRTINVISLSSLAIASGMVVDNAIVIVDNIFRRLERGNRPDEAAVFGASEMFMAVAASTLTTVVVFVPMLFIPGVVGIMFAELAIIIIVTLLASLFTAVTFTPMLCSKWLRVTNGAGVKRKGLGKQLYDFSEKQFTALEKRYASLLGRCLRHKKLVILGFLASLFLVLPLMHFVGNEFSPEEDSGDVRMSVQLAVGTRVEETDKIAAKIEEALKLEVPEARYYYVRSGQITGIGRTMGNASGSHIVSAGTKLVSKTERSRGVKDIAHVLREKIKGFPGVLKIDVSTGNPLSGIISGQSGKSVQFEIIGHSFEETDALAEKVRSIMEKIPGTVDVSVSRENKRPELVIQVDREKAAAQGLNMNTVTNSIKTYLQGSTASKYREKGKTYDIYVRLLESSRSNIEDIESLPIVAGPQGAQIRLVNIATVREVLGPQEIERKNRERVVRVECNAYRRSSGKIVEDLEREVAKIAIPADISVNIGGEAEEQAKAFKDLTMLMALGLILVYMVMAGQFESLLDPLIVMFAVPFTFIGVVLGFILTGTTLNIMSFLGMVMLVGIVVNNAIVLVSYINILRARGMPMFEAVTTAGKDRLRPVLMTTLTTLMGLSPLAFARGEGSESWQPLGITMISGLAVSTLITMLFVPTLYAVFEARLKKNGAKKNEVRSHG